MRKLAGLAAGAVGLAALAAMTLPGNAAPRAAAAKFGKAVKVTPDLGYGYEPTVISDKFGNLFATAHKENWQLAVGPDGRATTQNRSMSWAWWSRDNGKTWQNLPTGPGDAFSHNFGDEGDMASDDAGYTYFVDTDVTDITFTSWKASGKGEVSFVNHLPLAVFGEPVDDRPWVTAHGDGVVMYIGNEGNKNEYPGGQPPLGGNGEAANGPGRYTAYMSYDHGATWDHLGYQLKDSGWCRPAADHAKGSKLLYVVCGNDKDTVYSYVSADDGKHWKRYTIDEYAPASTDSYPTVVVGSDGTVSALHVSKNEDDPALEVIKLYRSKDHGKHWTKQVITPKKGQYVYTWLGVAKDGRLGMAAYYRGAKSQPWRVYGSVWKAGQQPVLTSLDEKNPVAPADATAPPGDYLTANFSPDGKLNIVWTRTVLRSPVANADPSGEVPKTLERDIYFARSL
jgi:BNR repeat-like domain